MTKRTAILGLMAAAPGADGVAIAADSEVTLEGFDRSGIQDASVIGRLTGVTVAAEGDRVIASIVLEDSDDAVFTSPTTPKGYETPRTCVVADGADEALAAAVVGVNLPLLVKSSKKYTRAKVTFSVEGAAALAGTTLSYNYAIGGSPVNIKGPVR